MANLIRVFVEKRQGFDVEAQALLADLRDNLGIKSIRRLRLLARYDVEGLTPPEFARAKEIVFSEPNVDTVYEEDFPAGEGCRLLITEYLPGQFDLRADSAAQCIQLLIGGELPKVAAARVTVFEGGLSDKDMARIKKYLINPVESREASPDKPESLGLTAPPPPPVARVDGFIGWDTEELEQYRQAESYAMSREDMAFCQRYFKEEEQRNPTLTELKVIDIYWSDHCRHSTFLTRLESVEIEQNAYSEAVTDAIQQALDAYHAARQEVYSDRIGQKDVSLMDMATMGMRLMKKRGQIPDLDESEEINACSVRVPVIIQGDDGESYTEDWLVQFKNETHNHPTEIEPFGGAATCLGGAIRDPLSGRAYVYQAMRVTGSGDPRQPLDKTLPGKLPARKITTGAAAGYSSYGNQIGIAAGQITEIYDPGYTAKRMELGAVIGAAPAANVQRGTPQEGDVVLLLGGRTGRDGCGGATGSSKAHTTESIDTCGAEVQKGNPPTERKIQRLFRNGTAARMIKRCNDFGAGGVCVAVGELAAGLEINLDAVPKKYEGLNGTELAISESQERMAVVLAAEDVPAFLALAEEENLEVTPVAAVTAEARVRMSWQNDRIVDLARSFLDTNGVTQTARAFIQAPDSRRDYRSTVPAGLTVKSLPETFLENLARLDTACQKGLVERFDASIGAGSVNMPFAGRYQLTPEEGMVAKLPLTAGETDDATAMTFGFVPGISRWSPFHGAAYAVTLSLARLAAMGAGPLSARLSFQEYFEQLREDPKRWGKPAAALLGGFLAQTQFGVPSIGGKDSMSGSFHELDVPPTLVSFAVAMTKASATGSAAFKKAGSLVALLPLPVEPETMLPDWARTRILFEQVAKQVRSGDIAAASVVREGGAAAAVARMCFGNRIGFTFHDVDRHTLFAPLAGSLMVELREGDMCLAGLQYQLLGTTSEQPAVILEGERLSLDQLAAQWMRPLEPVFPQDAPDAPMIEVPLYTDRSAAAPAIKTARPRVFIPVFPGTNCEVDSARAWRRAGAEAEIVVVKNSTPAAIAETLERFEQVIRRSQILMIPGGFSGGDEPDGSGKFIAAVFRSPRLSEAVADLMERRDGLILGICNGFQALIKLGLLPGGEIKTLNPEDPTLTFNTLGRHVSRMVYTRVASVKSPWLAGCEAGEQHTVAVSHGEGRFHANEESIRALIANGQIAFQYVDPQGQPSGDILWNPNGSVAAIEGITSPDGRILGKMGHSERAGENIFKNVPGEKDQKIFVSGVRYFE